MIQFQLKTGELLLLDEEDAYVLKFNWYCAHVHGYNRIVTNVYKHAHETDQHQYTLARAIMERKIGRSISRQEKVLHLNGNRCDCRRENLAFLSRSLEHVCIDDEDADLLEQAKFLKKRGKEYVVIHSTTGLLFVHRIIMSRKVHYTLDQSEHVVFSDGNTYHLQRENLVFEEKRKRKFF